MTTEIKPCPFCGNANNIRFGHGINDRRYFVKCGDCGAQSGEQYVVPSINDLVTNRIEIPEDVVKQWNMRAAL